MDVSCAISRHVINVVGSVDALADTWQPLGLRPACPTARGDLVQDQVRLVLAIDENKLPLAVNADRWLLWAPLRPRAIGGLRWRRWLWRRGYRGWRRLSVGQPGILRRLSAKRRPIPALTTVRRLRVECRAR